MSHEATAREMKTMRMPLAALMLSLVSIASAQYHTPGTKTARSPSGRYAIQERNGRPWLLDTTKGTAQLLADDTAGRQLVAPGFPSYDAQPLQVLISAISHEPLKSAVKWHQRACARSAPLSSPMLSLSANCRGMQHQRLPHWRSNGKATRF
jgi:hypothetical protein